MKHFACSHPVKAPPTFACSSRISFTISDWLHCLCRDGAIFGIEI